MTTATQNASKNATPKSAASTRARRKAAAPREFLLSTEQYLKMAEAGFFEGRRVELIEGKVIEMAAMNDPHWWSTAKTTEALRDIFPPPFFVLSQMPIHTDEHTEPEPDVMVLKTENGLVSEMSKARAPSQAALLVEVSDSTLAYDRTTKARLYARAGIAEYWIVDLRSRRLLVHRAPQNGKYSETRVLASDENVSPLAAPDAEIAVADLLP